MSCQRLGLVISVLFHLGVVIFLTGALPDDSGAGRRVHMDFSIMDTARTGTPATKSHPVKKKQRVVKKEVKPAQQEVTAPVPEEIPEPVNDDPVEESVEEAASGEATAGAAEHGARGRDFSYIKELLQRNLEYPAVARRKGWEGRVVVEFVICFNGSVRDIRILETSGKALLDRSAVDVVRRTSPFPEHPNETRVVIPIVYSLLQHRDT